MIRLRHYLKTWPAYFEAVKCGDKSFEVRRNDRTFQVGDLVHLEEWDPATSQYTKRVAHRRISYVLQGSEAEKFGLVEGFCVLGLSALDPDNERDADALSGFRCSWA